MYQVNVLAKFMHYFILQPLFISLAQFWSAFQDQVVVLSVLSNITNSLSQFATNSLVLCESEDFLVLLPGTIVLSDDERKQKVNQTTMSRTCVSSVHVQCTLYTDVHVLYMYVHTIIMCFMFMLKNFHWSAFWSFHTKIINNTYMYCRCCRWIYGSHMALRCQIICMYMYVGLSWKYICSLWAGEQYGKIISLRDSPTVGRDSTESQETVLPDHSECNNLFIIKLTIYMY